MKKRLKPGPGWEHLNGGVWEHKTGMRIHTGGGLILLPEGSQLWVNTTTFSKQHHSVSMQTGWNKRRTLMIMAVEYLKMLRSLKPAFIPLKAEYYDAFEAGEKRFEFRKLGGRWRKENFPVGRRVILSRGYGKSKRMEGLVTCFVEDENPYEGKYPGFKECYGVEGPVACIGILTETNKEHNKPAFNPPKK